MSLPINMAPATFPTPWAARSFAIVSAIAEAGWFELRDFQQALITCIRQRELGGGCIDDEASYYDCWIESLTTLLGQRGASHERLVAIESAIRDRHASRAHTHDPHDEDDAHDHGHDHSLASILLQPLYVEQGALLQLSAKPYPFPIEGAFDPKLAALIVIDMQRDFCDPSGYMGLRGDDVSVAAALIPRISELCAAARLSGMHVIFTREGHTPDLGDLPLSKRAKTRRAGAEIGASGPLGRLLVRGEAGWEIVPELAPHSGDVVVDKVGTGAFYATDLEHRLRTQGISEVVLVGVTTGVCVSTTAREASDRGFNVLVLSDCCAEPDQHLHEAAIELLQVESGYIAAVADGSALMDFLSVHAQGSH